MTANKGERWTARLPCSRAVWRQTACCEHGPRFSLLGSARSVRSETGLTDLSNREGHTLWHWLDHLTRFKSINLVELKDIRGVESGTQSSTSEGAELLNVALRELSTNMAAKPPGADCVEQTEHRHVMPGHPRRLLSRNLSLLILLMLDTWWRVLGEHLEVVHRLPPPCRPPPRHTFTSLLRSGPLGAQPACCFSP